MYLLVLLRFFLGLLPRTSHAAEPMRFCAATGASRSQRIRAGSVAIPHEWMCMDYVLTESRGGITRRGCWAFVQANHSLRSVFRLARRLAGLPEAYPAL